MTVGRSILLQLSDVVGRQSLAHTFTDPFVWIANFCGVNPAEAGRTVTGDVGITVILCRRFS